MTPPEIGWEGLEKAVILMLVCEGGQNCNFLHFFCLFNCVRIRILAFFFVFFSSRWFDFCANFFSSGNFTEKNYIFTPPLSTTPPLNHPVNGHIPRILACLHKGGGDEAFWPRFSHEAKFRQIFVLSKFTTNGIVFRISVLSLQNSIKMHIKI